MADLTVTAANVIAASSAQTDNGVAGETIAAGKAVYLKAADGRLWLAQCDGAAAEAVAVGIARHAATAGQPISYVKGGQINIGATTAKTTAYMVSAAAGGVCPQADLSSGNYITYLGYATATDGTFIVAINSAGVVV